MSFATRLSAALLTIALTPALALAGVHLLVTIDENNATNADLCTLPARVNMVTITTSSTGGGDDALSTVVTIGGTVVAADVNAIEVYYNAILAGSVTSPATLTNDFLLPGNQKGKFDWTYDVLFNASAAGKTFDLTITSITPTDNAVLPYTTASYNAVGCSATTTIGDGTDPGNASLCPGDGITDLDSFTLQTSAATDSVAAVEVTLAAGTAAGLSEVAITSDDGLTTYGSVPTPGSDVVSISTSGLTADTGLTQYKVRVTPLSHAAMPAVPGSTYTVTGTITGITVSNPVSGTDAGSATVTIDNSSPANPTWGTITPSNGQVVLNWINPGDGDFSEVVILRNTSTPIGDAPTEGTTYTVPGSINTSTIVYVGALETFTDTSVSNGTDYYYEIFARDTCVNYSAGAETGPHTPNQPTTTLGDGTDPSATPTACPNGGAVFLDAFSFQTSSGSDDVTALTVNLAAGTAAGISLLEITNAAGTVVYGSVASPGSDTVNVTLSTNTLSATTTLTEYRVRITPKAHAPLPAPPGSSYAVTGIVSAFTPTANATAGSDVDSDTITIDNASPSNPTWGTITPGDTQVVLNWTNPGDADFNEVVILRNTSTPINDAPTEGTTYSTPGTIGTSTIVYVGALQTFTDTSVSNGTDYYYEIFARDDCINYSTGSETGPHTPAGITTTVGDGTDPSANPSRCPGGISAVLDAFTLQTSTGTDTVTAVQVTLAAGTAAGLSLVEITNDAGGSVYGSVPTPGSDVVNITTTGLTATTGSTQYKVRITPKSHAAMAAPPGASYSVTGTVTAITSSNSKVYNEVDSDTVSIDNTSPSNPSWGTITPGDGQVVLNWTNPGGDFAEVVILRNTSTPITDGPTEGSTYSTPGSIGTSTIVYVGSLQTFTDTGVTNGTDYWYEIFARDGCVNYSTGSETGPHQPVGPITVIVREDGKCTDPGQWTWSAGALNDQADGTVATATTDGDLLRSCIANNIGWNCRQIDSITVWVRASQVGNETIDFGLWDGATDYHTGSPVTPPIGGVFQDYSNTWNVRPWDSNPFTWTDIDNLVVSVVATRVGGMTDVLVSEIWVEVTYDPSVVTCFTTTLGDGTDPSATPTACPSGSAVFLDAFSFQTSSGSDNVTALTVDLAVGTAAGISLLEITNAAGTVVYGSVASPGSDSVNVTLSDNTLTATTTLTEYRVRITPKAHAPLPAPPGSSYAITGTVGSFTPAANSAAGTDTDSDTVTVDNTSPANPTWGAVSPGDSQVVLNWTNPGGDFAEVVILRNTATPITDGPTEGASYSTPGTIGTSTIIYVGALQTFTDSSAVNLTDYWYEIFAKDDCGNYSVGTETGPHQPQVVTQNGLIVGAADATVDSCTQITVSVPFTGDDDNDSSTDIESGPSASGPWSAVCSSLSSASPRSCVDSSLADQTGFYYRITHTDLDGVSGTNPAVIGPYITPDCTADDTIVDSNSAETAGCRQLTVTAVFTGDDNGDGSTLIEYDTAVGFPTPANGCTGLSGPSPRQCDIPELNPNTDYWVRITHTDATDGVNGTNPQVLGPFNTGVCAGDGVAPMILVQSPSFGAVIGGDEVIKVQVWDPDGPGGTPLSWSLDGVSQGTTGVLASASYTCGTDCTIYEITVDTTVWTNGEHRLTLAATDSQANSARKDHYVEVFNLGGVPGGDGYMLRRTHGSQLCTDCHALPTHSSQGTDTSYGNWALACLSCHTPHATKNIYLIRETIQTPRSGSKSIDFHYDDRLGGTNDGESVGDNPTNLGFLGDFSGTLYDDGICEACHTRTSHYRNDTSGGDHTHNSGARCVDCHEHTKGFAGAGCNGCHDAPPAVGAHAAHDEVWDSTAGNTASSYTDTSSHADGAANKYGMACAVCHSTDVNDHQNDDTNNPTHDGSAGLPWQVELLFSPLNPTAAFAQTYNESTDQGPSLDYWSFSNGTCSSSYCHSNAAPLGGTNQSVVTSGWTSATATTCTSCHNTNAATDAGALTDLSAAHGTHILSNAEGGYTFTCDECHSETLVDDISPPLSSLSFKLVLGSGKELHVNGTKDVFFSSTATSADNVDQSAATASSAYNGGTNTCSNIYCHSQGTTTTQPFPAPHVPGLAWNGSATCESCHGGDSVATNPMASNAHGAHMDTAAPYFDLQCAQCHDDTVDLASDGAIGTGGNTFHVNGARNLNFNMGGTYNGAFGCTNAYCHSSGTETPTYVNPPDWDSGTTLPTAGNECTQCHGTEGSSLGGEPMYGANNSHDQAGHVTDASAALARQDCQKCHGDTVDGSGNLIAPATGLHLNGSRDVVVDAVAVGAYVTTYAEVAETCQNACHNNISASTSLTWGAAAISCRDCHLRTSDADSWAWNDTFASGYQGAGTVASISSSQWLSTGHGNTAGFSESGNATAPDFDNGADGCLYCHTAAIGHNNVDNPFRLANIGAGNTADTKNGVCLACHETGDSGYLGKNSGLNVDAYHEGSKHADSGTGDHGGTFCWDCHDPHGDSIAYMIQETPTENHLGGDGTTRWGGYAESATYAATPTGFDKTGGDDNAAWDFDDYVDATGPPYTGLCQVCHDVVPNFQKTLYTGGHQGGTQACTNCHTHDQPPADAFKPAGGGDCLVCHSTGGSGQGQTSAGGYDRRPVENDFDDTLVESHHVGNSGLSGIMGGVLTNFDCVVCHAEGDASGGETATNATYHDNNVIDLKDADGGTVYTYDKNNVDATDSRSMPLLPSDGGSVGNWSSVAAGSLDWAAEMQNELDPFCLSCHDADGATSTYNLDDTGSGHGTGSALNPFADLTISNEYDQYDRTRVTDIDSRVNATGQTDQDPYNGPGANNQVNRAADGIADPPEGIYARHAISGFSASTYTSNSIPNWATGWNDQSTMACADCHTTDGANETSGNAHGSTSEYLLKDSAGTAAEGTDGTDNYNCYLCHPFANYQPGVGHTSKASDYTDYTADVGNSRVPSGNSGGNLYAIACTNCHGGVVDGAGNSEFGTIHGTSQVMRIGDGPNTRGAYRFMNGNSMRFYDPNGWTGNAVSCWTIGGADFPPADAPDAFGGCTKHDGAQAFTKPVTRNLKY